METPIRIPLLNPNETEVRIVNIAVANGQYVHSGEVICTLETTKSTADLEATDEGYIVGLTIIQGQLTQSGQIFCYLSEDPDWVPPPEIKNGSGDQQGITTDLPQGLRITQPALLIARQSGIDLASLPLEQLVTVDTVRSLVSIHVGEEISQLPDQDFDPSAIIVYGAGGHGKSVIELIQAGNFYRLHGIIDDNVSPGGFILGIPVLGGPGILPELFARGIRQAANAVGGIGNIEVRARVFDKIMGAGFICPPLVHPRAFIEPSASVSPGAQILPLAYVGSQSQIGFGCIINTGAIISHDCVLGEYANIAPGAILAGEVQVGPRVLVGMGVTVNLQVKIGSGARIGNGSTVKDNVPENGIIRAGSIWP